MTGLYVAAAAILIAAIFGSYRRYNDGRTQRVTTQVGGSLDPAELGAELGRQATFVQFSSPVCAPCRSTHRLLADVVAGDSDLGHIDLNAADRLDLVERLHIARTPTVLILDGRGQIRHRIVGAARKTEVLDALEQLAIQPAA